MATKLGYREFGTKTIRANTMPRENPFWAIFKTVGVMGDYTDGWQHVQPGTMERIIGILSPLQGDGDTKQENT